MSSSHRIHTDIEITGPVYIWSALFGNTDRLEDFVSHQYKIGNEVNIILLGDVCLGAPKHEENIKRAFSSIIDNGGKIYIIRGSHDDPKCWENPKWNDQAVLLQDNTIINVNGNWVYVVGGGIPYTDPDSLESASDTMFVPMDAIRAAKGRLIQAILSYTGPSRRTLMAMRTSDEKKLPFTKTADFEFEKIQFSRLESLRPMYWIYGNQADYLRDIMPNGTILYALSPQLAFDGLSVALSPPRRTFFVS